MSATEANTSCLLEAMACKTTIISSELDELKEIIKDEEQGLFVKPKDSASITIKILKLLNDPKLSKKLAENAFKDIKKYDINKITKEYLKIYKKLVRNLS